MDNLPEQIVNRIEGEAIVFEKKYEHDKTMSVSYMANFSYAKGATSEATRSLILLEALERVASGLFHMTPQSAKDLITSYNNQQTI